MYFSLYMYTSINNLVQYLSNYQILIKFSDSTNFVVLLVHREWVRKTIHFAYCQYVSHIHVWCIYRKNEGYCKIIWFVKAIFVNIHFSKYSWGGRNFIKLLGYVMYKDCVWLFVLGISTVEGTHTIHENYSPSLPLTWILIILTKSSLACVCSRSRASTFSLALVCCSC